MKNRRNTSYVRIGLLSTDQHVWQQEMFKNAYRSNYFKYDMIYDTFSNIRDDALPCWRITYPTFHSLW